MPSILLWRSGPEPYECPAGHRDPPVFFCLDESGKGKGGGNAYAKGAQDILRTSSQPGAILAENPHKKDRPGA